MVHSGTHKQAAQVTPILASSQLSHSSCAYLVEVYWLQLFGFWQNPMAVVLAACSIVSAVQCSCHFGPPVHSQTLAELIHSLLETTTVAVVGDVTMLPLVPGMSLSVLAIVSTPAQLFL